MVSVDPPAPLGILTLPTIREIWRAVTVDRAVAITALVCATVVACVLIWGLVHASDATAIALALSTVIASAIGAWVKARNGKGESR